MSFIRFGKFGERHILWLSGVAVCLTISSRESYASRQRMLFAVICERTQMRFLETTRLLLRQLTLDDLDAVTILYSDPVVMAYKGGIRSPEQTEQHFKSYLEEYGSVGYCFWAVLHRQHHFFLGLCGLLDQQDINGQPEVEIAYTFAKEYWNQGLATEAAQACKDYGFQILGLSRLVSTIAIDNTASQRVALKNGTFYERDFVDKTGQMMRLYTVHHPDTP